MTEPVRVVLDDDLSHSLRWLFQHLQPQPTMTGMVEQAVREWLEKRRERDVFKDLPRFRPQLRALP